jgi:hypothetical protein
MIFVDGENLAIRVGKMLDDDATLQAEMHFERNVYLWSPFEGRHGGVTPAVMRTYYYTSLSADEAKIAKIQDELKELDVDSPRVFKKKEGRSKRVDITLAIDMLSHASRRHFDVAILVAGDEDYVPLVEAVQREGAQVHVWFVENGISPMLRRAADHYVDLGPIIFEPVKIIKS